MSELVYLLDEICCGLEIYFTGRTGGQYLKTAFILCDDYTELTSKLFLLTDDSKWSDKNSESRYKSYHDVQKDVASIFKAKRSVELGQLEKLHGAMKARRDRRNEFFHSTKLLDLSVIQRNCVEAFCDLLDYGRLLFGSEWGEVCKSARNYQIMEVLLKLEVKGFSDPSVIHKLNEILKKWPRNSDEKSKKGVHLAIHPDDLHMRLCIRDGGSEFRDKIATLL